MANEVRGVPLPAGAERPLRVYVNGEEVREGAGFTVVGDALVFDPPLRARPRLGLGRSIMLALGIGVYGDLRGDTLDVQYHSGGVPRAATLPLRAEEESPPPPA